MNVLLGVSGGIAAYKAADLVSQCRRKGWNVRVVMTRGATEFVRPLTFEALSDHPVMTDALATGHAPDGASAIEHIAWAKWAHVAMVAPLTASTLAKLATGIADDALTTVWLALPAHVPSLLAPAMNTAMWEQPVVQRNLRWLDELGRHVLVPPVSKRLACGDVGVGGLAEVADLVAALEAHAP
ncbi:MAG: phosphopantothenoylcysteine decarboxylase [Myxococcales bacterium]|nr:phosphopantothenoylcysteine decarboxylase [Myxococcales bacterium]